MSVVLAIDPGSKESAFVTWDGKQVVDKRLMPNDKLLYLMEVVNADFAESLVIEMIASMGLKAGNEVFETAYWVGRFCEVWRPRPFSRIKRQEVKMYLTGSMRSNDADIRHAIISRFGGKEKAVGNVKKPGPLYGVATHMWSALAVALTWEANNGKQG